MTANIQVSGKYPDGRIFVAGGNTFDEFFTNAADLLGNDAARQLIEDFSILHNPDATGAVGNAAPLRTASAAPAAPASAPSAPGAPVCSHGPMKFFPKGFSEKTQKEYSSSWRCQSRDRNDQCKAKWNND